SSGWLKMVVTMRPEKKNGSAQPAVNTTSERKGTMERCSVSSTIGTTQTTSSIAGAHQPNRRLARARRASVFSGVRSSGARKKTESEPAVMPSTAKEIAEYET